MQLHILKTNIKNPEDLHKIRTLMLDLNIKRWTVDEEDIDKVLRIESPLNAGEIIESVKNTVFNVKNYRIKIKDICR